MGLLRFLLAVSVIFSHSGSLFGCTFVGGEVAVETFFIISGFYITLILNEKYIKANNSYKLFISNRFLRLFPLYWIILIASLTCAYFIPHYRSQTPLGDLNEWRQHGSALDIKTTAFLIGTNILLFFQDAVMYMGIDIKTGGIFFTANFLKENLPAYKFLLVPQAWSIGLELTFYLVAPFIVRRKYPIIIALVLISMCAKIYGASHGLNSDPWTYRFFPFELMYFLLGSLAYLIYKNYVENAVVPGYVYKLLFGFVTVFTIVFSLIHIKYLNVFYTTVVFISIPFLFNYTKKFKIDRFIGELSYPMYITHIMVLNIINAIGITKHQNIITIAISIILSIILIKVVGDRIEKFRQARVKKQKGIKIDKEALSVKFN